jgi:hypothetical protein
MFILSLLGGLLLIVLPGIWKKLRKDRTLWTRVGLMMLIWLPVAVLPASSWSETQGRYSGLWNLAKHWPVVEDRSVLLVPLSVIGAGLLGWVLMSQPKRWGVLAGVTISGFILAQTANAMAWQKYYEPFLLIYVLLLVCGPGWEACTEWSSRRTASERDAR